MFKKKQAMKRGGAVKKRGGGMMGPKKKMAKGGSAKKGMTKDRMTQDRAMQLARARKPSGRLTVDDLKQARAKMPTGRSAAAKKIANKSLAAKAKASFMKGKGNPAGKDLSVKGRTTGMLERLLGQLSSGRGIKSGKLTATQIRKLLAGSKKGK